MADTKIEWADRVWNPVTGCTKISPGCANCYAERMAARLAGRCGYPKDIPFAVTMHPAKLNEPLHWRKPARIFVCSMSDLFHQDVPFYFIDDVFDQIKRCRQHTFLILTKRPERMYAYFDSSSARVNDGNWIDHTWIGVTAENQEQADKRIPILLQTPAAVRFVSVEPMLGPVDVSKWLGDQYEIQERGGISLSGSDYGRTGDRLSGADLADCCSPGRSVERENQNNTMRTAASGESQREVFAGQGNDQRYPGECSCSQDGLAALQRSNSTGNDCQSQEREEMGQRSEQSGTGNVFRADQPCDSYSRPSPETQSVRAIRWVICGGESGVGARPMHPIWARSLRDQCQAAGVPFMFKQWGEWVTEEQRPPDIVLPGRAYYPDDWDLFDFTTVYKVGKKKAGRLIDCQLWDQYPGV